LRNVMQQGGYVYDQNGERRHIGAMSQRGRDFARFAMDQNNNKPKPKYHGQFYFESLSMNSSNREDGRNRDGSRVRK
jgi:hypothetical protein